MKYFLHQLAVALSMLVLWLATPWSVAAGTGNLRKLAEKAGVETLSLKDIPAFQLHTLEGDTLSYPGLEQRLIVLHFWATWCMPCRKEMPELEQLSEKAARLGLSLLIVGVSIDEGDRIQQVQLLVRKLNVRFPIAVAEQSRILEAFWTWGIPVSYLIQPGAGFVGRIRGTAHWLEGPLWELVRHLATRDTSRLNH